MGHVCTCGDCTPEPFVDQCHYQAEAERLRGICSSLGERLDWIERDRREPDKVLTELASARRLIDDAKRG